MSDAPILAGLKVIDAATYIAAPSAAAMLADFGAEVIKIERPPHGDPFRYLHHLPGLPSSPVAYPFLMDNRNKRSLAVNLGCQQGREILLKLVAHSDVFITNYQPQMQARFRLSYQDLVEVNSRLIYASVTGYGETGEEAEKPGYDMTAYYARSGLMDFLYNAGGDLALPPCGFGDHPTAVSLLSGILLALHQRHKTGKGSKVTTTLMHNGVWANSSLAQGALCGARWPERPRRHEPPNPLVNHYRAGDGKRILFCLLDAARDWPKLCAAIERSEWTGDPRFATPDARCENSAALVALLDAELARYPLEEWMRRFRDQDVLFGIVAETEALPRDAQMAATGVFVPLEGSQMQTIDSPMRLEGVSKVPPRMPPCAGEHTRRILAELGYSGERIAEMEAVGVVMQGESS